jgi:lipopolysaccharide/colanic/teichoic acid biosynthesis glycosyltransferase
MVAAERAPYPRAKWAEDKVLSALLMLVLSPLLAIAACALAADSLLSRRDRGRWIYRERRVSRGEEFDLLKFRTLRRDVLEAAAGEEGHARLLEGDPSNLTWAGRRILKPWYLDELPQLWNVLRGDMSLVGPRPWPPSMVRAQVARGQDYRLRVMAGWTGPAQVQKGVTESVGYAALDLLYVDVARTAGNVRLCRTDVAILWKTVRVMARGEGLEF